MVLNNIISERLIIRVVEVKDAKDVWEIWSNSQNEKYMRDPVDSLEETVSICEGRENNKENGYLTVATLKDTGEVIGTCNFGSTSKEDEWGFGYSIKQEFWGKGYATEIVKAIIRFGQSLEIKDFISDCAIENVASGRVLEKCGMNKDHIGSFRQPKLDIIYKSQVYKLHVN